MLYRLLIFFLALVSRALILTAVMPLACYAKVWTAKKLGDRTAERAGRLSLDFRKHTDFFGMMVILVFGFGWSKEINIDVSRLKNMKRDVTLISLASPLTYFLMYIILRNVGGAVLSISPDVFILQCVCAVLNKAAFASLFFGVIALLPIPPLDGFHVFYQFSWPKFRRWYFTNYQKITVWSRYILIFIFFMGSITDGAFSVLDLLGNLWRLLLDRLVFFGTGPIQIF